MLIHNYQLREGDAIIYRYNEDGLVDDIIPITADNILNITSNGGLGVLSEVNETRESYPYRNGTMISSDIKNTSFAGNKAVSFVFAPVIDRSNRDITLALNLTDENDGRGYTSPISGKTFQYSSTVTACRFESSARPGYYVQPIHDLSQIEKSTITSYGKDLSTASILWNSEDNKIAYALVKLINDQVQEVYSITTAD